MPKLKSFFLRKEELQIVVDSLRAYIDDYEEFDEQTAGYEEKEYYNEARELYASLSEDLQKY